MSEFGPRDDDPFVENKPEFASQLPAGSLCDKCTTSGRCEILKAIYGQADVVEALSECVDKGLMGECPNWELD